MAKTAAATSPAAAAAATGLLGSLLPAIGIGDAGGGGGRGSFCFGKRGSYDVVAIACVEGSPRHHVSDLSRDSGSQDHHVSPDPADRRSDPVSAAAAGDCRQRQHQHPAICQLASAARFRQQQQQPMFRSSQSVNRLPLHGSSGSLCSSCNGGSSNNNNSSSSSNACHGHSRSHGHGSSGGLQQQTGGSACDLLLAAAGGRESLAARYRLLRALLADLRAQKAAKEAELARLVAEEKALSSSTDRCQPTQFLVPVAPSGDADALTRQLEALQLEMSVQRAKVEANTRLLREAKESRLATRQMKKRRMAECQQAQERLHQLNRRIHELRATALATNGHSGADLRLDSSLGSLTDIEQLSCCSHPHAGSLSDLSRDSSSQSLSAGLAFVAGRQPGVAAAPASAVPLRRGGANPAARFDSAARRSNSLGDLLSSMGETSAPGRPQGQLKMVNTSFPAVAASPSGEVLDGGLPPLQYTQSLRAHAAGERSREPPLDDPDEQPWPRPQRRYLKKTGSASKAIRPPACYFQDLPPPPQSPQPHQGIEDNSGEEKSTFL